MASMLRVHSRDLHEHIAQEAGDSLVSGQHTDLGIRCKEGVMVQCHRLVMSAVSPYLKQMLDMTEEEDHTILDMPDSDHEVVQSLLDIVYNGSIEASLEEIRRLLTLAHSLYISVPVSDQLMSMLGLQLPPQPKLGPPTSPKPQGPEFPFPGGLQAMSMWQQQILGQYAMMNGLLASGGQPPAAASLPASPSSPRQEPPASKRMKTDSLMAHLPGLGQGSKELLAPHLNQIVVSAFRPENGTYVCSVCHSSYTNKGNFKQHIEKHFKNGELPVNGSSSILSNSNNGKIGSFEPAHSSGAAYKCHICHSTYSHPGNFKQHLLKHEREKRGMSGNDGSHLSNVLQSAFADRVDNGDPCKTYICHECNRTFKHPGNFKQHMASHNKQLVTAPNFPMDNMVRRPMPGLVKMVNGNLSNENIIKTELDRDWDCPECGDKFGKGKELQTHMKTVHNIEMVLQPEEAKAEVSGDGAVSPPRLSTDDGLKALAMAVGTEGWLGAQGGAKRQTGNGTPSPGLNDNEVRCFPCGQCGKQFAKMSKLTQHMKTHSPEDHYKHPCDICGKKFTRPQHVIRHKLLHTGEKPHACPNAHCDKSFAREDKLKHHLLKGCTPNSNGDLDQSIDSRDSRDSETHEEIDDDEDSK